MVVQGQMHSDGDGNVVPADRNRPAEFSLWSGMVGILVIVLFLVSRQFSMHHIISPIVLLPVCGLAATIGGIVGLTRARTTGGSAAQSVLGLLLGLSLLGLFAVTLLFIWVIGHASFDF